MPKPRYDEEENKSRHAATDEGKCEEMSRKYGWELIEVEKTPDEPIFKADCVFAGKTEFPKSYNENEQELD
ncbi:hypothetical protein [Fortiea contorta]|uniref:hypothetical protein n=1 Tax=Fortiea contorta TaxID=1892405 RepID=UPI00034CA4E1|nr:hypothetical protein [Fortiea contorta]